MSAESLLAEFLSIATDPAAYLTAWRRKHRGGKVVGCVHCMPNYVPEEILDASGILPVGIWGASVPVARADALMQPFACSMARTALELGLEGHLEVLDGMAFSTCCDTLKNLAEIWKGHFPEQPVHSVIFPAQQRREAAATYLAAELDRFRAVAGAWGKPADDAALSKSLGKYEDDRRAMREMAVFRMESPELIAAREASLVVTAASMMDRGEHAAMVRELIEALPQRGQRVKPGRRIVLSGTLPLPLIVGDIIEECGGMVVADDLGLGAKYYELELPDEGDPIARLTAMLLSHSPVSTIHPKSGLRARHLLDLANACGAEAIVFNATKFCEPEFFDHPNLKKDLDAAGMPSMLLETELGSTASGALSTRIGAFLESLD